MSTPLRCKDIWLAMAKTNMMTKDIHPEMQPLWFVFSCLDQRWQDPPWCAQSLPTMHQRRYPRCRCKSRLKRCAASSDHSSDSVYCDVCIVLYVLYCDVCIVIHVLYCNLRIVIHVLYCNVAYRHGYGQFMYRVACVP